MPELDPNYNADLLDAMADQFEEEQEAMRESMQSQWSLIEDDHGNFIGFSVHNTEEYDDQD